MHMMVEGEWRTDAFVATNEAGEFTRSVTQFREEISSEADARFPPVADRYHIYISRACPWAHRVAITRRLLGLDDQIGLSVVEPVRIDDGWEFSEEHPDPLGDARYLREVYRRADPSYTGRVTVPVLWDTVEETIVNNESREIMRMLSDAYDAPTGVDLAPPAMRPEIDAAIDDIYEPINNGVYRAGFAETQEAYTSAIDELFTALDTYDRLLGEQRFVVGDRLTEADIALFVTLVRFDDVYHTHFKCNRRAITAYPNLWGHTREIYQLPGVAETVNRDHIRRHYYASHTDINPKQIVAVGPELSFTDPHDRDRLGGQLPAALS
ncbi:UNVERIFIED_CONTAM: glutathione-dependent reductase [Euhalothece sp. KZN 001]